MDWAQIATTTVAVLAPMLPYLTKVGEKATEEFGKKIGDSAWERGRALYELIRKKFAGDSYAEGTLQRTVQKPEDETRQAALATVIKEKAEEDEEFGRQLFTLTQTAIQSQDIQTFLTNVYGKVDKIFNIGRIGKIDSLG